MTRLQAERITGARITVCYERPWYTYTATVGGMVMVTGVERSEPRALKAIVDAMYQMQQREAVKERGPLCERCGSMGGSTHHKQYRSKGRVDDKSNLEILCPHCDRKEHGG